MNSAGKTFSISRVADDFEIIFSRYLGNSKLGFLGPRGPLRVPLSIPVTRVSEGFVGLVNLIL